MTENKEYTINGVSLVENYSENRLQLFFPSIPDADIRNQLKKNGFKWSRCNELAFRVILPLLKPVMATIALWTIVSHWNAWFDCMIYITDPDKKVLQLVVRDLVVSVSNASKNIDMMDFNLLNNVQLHSANVTSAAVLVTIGPIVLVYPFLQKYFVKGVMVGSLKG